MSNDIPLRVTVAGPPAGEEVESGTIPPSIFPEEEQRKLVGTSDIPVVEPEDGRFVGRVTSTEYDEEQECLVFEAEIDDQEVKERLVSDVPVDIGPRFHHKDRERCMKRDGAFIVEDVSIEELRTYTSLIDGVGIIEKNAGEKEMFLSEYTTRWYDLRRG